MKTHLEEAVTWKSFVTVVGLMLTTATILVGGVIQHAEASGKEIASVSRTAVAALDAKVESNRRDADAGLETLRTEITESRKDTQAIYNFLLTRQRQSRMEKQ